MGISKKIIIGLIIFTVLVSIPFLYNAARQQERPEISLDTPEIQALDEKKCIEDTAYMRANHADLLADWKISVVREGERIYVAEDGQEYLMSLQQTCLHCHSNKEEFCDSCHYYLGAQPNCWRCHLDTRE
ncbi:MAG: sulfate reduction electron transfer complex DsrMKJOP subunit DsrJ [Bacillota bacterium]